MHRCLHGPKSRPCLSQASSHALHVAVGPYTGYQLVGPLAMSCPWASKFLRKFLAILSTWSVWRKWPKWHDARWIPVVPPSVFARYQRYPNGYLSLIYQHERRWCQQKQQRQIFCIRLLVYTSAPGHYGTQLLCRMPPCLSLISYLHRHLSMRAVVSAPLG